MINDPLYNHTVFGPNKGKGGIQGKSDAQLIQDLIAIHNAENWLGMDGDSELSMFNKDGKAPFFAKLQIKLNYVKHMYKLKIINTLREIRYSQCRKLAGNGRRLIVHI